MKQVEIDFAVRGKEEGMKRAVDHADSVIPAWSDQAYNFLKSFTRESAEFLTEDVRRAAVGKLPDPPNLKAWGAVIIRAAKEGLIKNAGYRKAKHARSHQRPSTLWKRNEL